MVVRLWQLYNSCFTSYIYFHEATQRLEQPETEDTVVRSQGGYTIAKSGTNYTPEASSSLREFRIGSREKPSVTQAPRAKVFQENLAALPPRVEQMGEQTNRRTLLKQGSTGEELYLDKSVKTHEAN